MKKRVYYDSVVKDMFQPDRPGLLKMLTGGRKIVAFLNTEFAVVDKRIADLLIRFADGIQSNVILKEAFASVQAKGKAEGLAEGKAEGKAGMLKSQLEAKFGSIPKWALARIHSATSDQLDRWALKTLNAASLEQVIRKR